MAKTVAHRSEDLRRYLLPEVAATLSNLELIARLVVEGFMTGLHKSPYHGFSIEFSQHRPYMAGDSLRFVDWKVYGRTDRFYIKQFEEETNLRSYLLLDTSASMQYGSGQVKKSDYAAFLTAALAYLFIKQRDAAGLVLFDDQVREILPPRSVPSYLSHILHAIGQAEFGKDTQINRVLHQVAERLKRRGLIVLISDLMDEPEKILAGLKHFRHDKHEVLVFHIMDRSEADFAFGGEIQFEDLESGERVKTQPRYIRGAYREQIQKFMNYYKLNFSNNRIDYQLLFTDTPFDVAINEYLLKRKRLY